MSDDMLNDVELVEARIRTYVPDGFRDEDGVWHDGPLLSETLSAYKRVVANLEAAETALDRALRQRDEARQDEALARAQLAYWRKGYEDARAALAAGRGEQGR